MDTHVLVWLLDDDERLGTNAKQLSDRALATDALAVSAITFWEIAMLVAAGRLSIRTRLESWRNELLDTGLRELALAGDIGIQAAELRSVHRDPADRMIVATCLAHGATLMTADQRLLDWSGDLARCDART